jgi:hypothetical protein
MDIIWDNDKYTDAVAILVLQDDSSDSAEQKVEGDAEELPFLF